MRACVRVGPGVFLPQRRPRTQSLLLPVSHLPPCLRSGSPPCCLSWPRAIGEYARRLLKGCAASHYEDLKMQATVDRFKGKLDEFLDFPRKEWGWIIEHDQDQDKGVILINENKPNCVCPLVQKGQSGDLGILCYGSEGFEEKMFSEVVGSPVRAEVVECVLRGHKSCKYRIELGRSKA